MNLDGTSKVRGALRVWYHPELVCTGTLSRVSASLNHAVALTAEGALYAWGNNLCGQLGLGDLVNRYTPTKIDALSGVRIVEVAVGVEHTLALASDGRLYAFGCNGRGSLGLGSSTLGTISQPTIVNTPETFVKLAAGSLHSVGLTASGAVYTWGANDQGQLGTSSSFVKLRATPRTMT